MCTPTSSSSEPVAAAGSIPRIGDPFPDFRANTTQGEMVFSEWQGDSWVVFFSHPADFTPVCSTEITTFAKRQGEFADRGVKLMGVSIDSIHSHLAWRENLKKIYDVEVGFPLIADIDMAVSKRLGMLHPGESATATVRAVFVIDPNRKVRAVVYYPLNVGRNVDEIVRLVDAIQTTDANACATPVNWAVGEKVIVPPPTTEEQVKERLDSDYEISDFYLCKRSL